MRVSLVMVVLASGFGGCMASGPMQVVNTEECKDLIADPAKSYFYGTVTDWDYSRPFPDAIVRATRAGETLTAEVDSRGCYAIEVEPRVSYRLQASLDGYRSNAFSDVDVGPGAAKGFTFGLERL